MSFEPLEPRQLLSVCTWTGGGTDDKWSTAANWSGNTAPVAGDQLVFSGSTQTLTQNDLAAGTSFQSIEIQSNGFSLGGNSLTVTGGITVDSGAGGSSVTLPVTLADSGADALVDNAAGTVTVAGPLTLAGNATLCAGAGSTLNVTGGIDNAGYTLLVDGAGATNISGGTTAVYSFTYSDTSGDAAYGTLTAVTSGLGGDGLWVIGGTLDVTACPDADYVGSYNVATLGPQPGSPSGYNWYQADNLLFPNDDAGNWSNNNGTQNPAYIDEYGVLFDRASSLPGYGGEQAVNLCGMGQGTGDQFYGWGADGNITYSVNSGGTFTPSAATIAGTGGLVKDGTGTLTLSGTNAYSGSTTVNNGILTIASSNALSANTSAVTVNSGGTLAFTVPVSTTTTIDLAGPGYNNLGALDNQSGDNSFTGPIALTAGATISSSAGTLTLGGSIDPGGNTLAFSGAGNVVVGDSMSLADNSGGDALVDDATGVVALAGAVTLTGNATLYTGTGGTLDVAASVANGGYTLVFDGPGSTYVGGGYSFTYSDTSGDAAQGTLYAVPSGLGGDGLWVIGGSLDVTACPDSDYVGNYNVATLGPQPGSPSGYSWYEADNLLFPNDDAGNWSNNNGTQNPAYIDEYGVLFDRASSLPGYGGEQALNVCGMGGSIHDQLYGWGADGNINYSVNSAGTFTPTQLSATISGTGGLTKNGTGTLTLAAANTYSGGTTVNGGTLQLGDGSTANGSVAGDIAVESGGTLVFADPQDQTYGGTITVSGSGQVVKTGAGTLWLVNSVAGGTIDVQAGLVEYVLQAAQTDSEAMVGMTLPVTVQLPSQPQDYQSVSFYLDSNGDGVIDSGDQLLGTVDQPAGGWSGTSVSYGVSTAGWAPGSYTVLVRGAIADGSTNLLSNVVSASVDLTADSAIVKSGDPGYQEQDPTLWSTVADAGAYGGQYRETSDRAASATYTFSGLAPGTYEFWVQYDGGSQHPSNVPLEIYDGSASTGNLQATFGVNEQSSLSTDNWAVRSFGGYSWVWASSGGGGTTVGTVYSNSGTITVVVPYAGAHTAAPTIWLIADPIGSPPVADGQAGGDEVSQDPDDIATGKLEKCSCAQQSPAIAPTYDNLTALVETTLGFAEATGEPQMEGDGMYVVVVVPCPCPCGTWCAIVFLEPERGYVALYGAKDAMVDNGTNLELTTSNGTVYTFADPTDQGPYSTGAWQSTVTPGGQVTQVVSGTDAQPTEIQSSLSATSHPYEEEQYQYITSGPNAGLVQSETYLDWVPAADDGQGAWEGTKQVNYTFYVTGQNPDSAGEYEGLTGDLQSATTQYWNGSAWTGSDTYYYRYYTGPTYNAAGQFIGFAHGLKREIMPASYASLASAVDPGGTPAQQLAAVSQLPDDDANTNPNCEIGKYTCFYYQYDVDRRVTLETVFGKLRTETYAYTEGSDDVQNADSSYNLDVWTTKTVETMADGSTYTVYSNYLGQTLLDDLHDVTTGQHTYTYYEYDSCGDMTLQANSSAITGYNDGDGTQVGTVSGTFGDDFRIHLGLPATAASPVTEYSYTYVTTGPFNPTSGLLASVSLADGLAGPSSSGSYYNADAVLQDSYTYDTYTYQSPNAGSQTIYVLASDTVYANSDGTGAEATSYTYTWYANSPQEKTVVTTLPVVSTTQNGSGLTAQTVNFYDSEGNLTWSKDARGFLTENIYDPTTGLVTEGIQDANTALVNPSELPTDPTTGQPLATPAGGGQNLVTDYSYDAEARLAQTLGPEHSAVVDGVATEVRTASWTVYDDADHATFSCQGYETVASGQFTLVDPVSVTITNPDGQVTNQIQATVDANDGTVGWVANAADAEVSLGSLSPLALLATTASGGIGLPPQSAYTAWTTDEYSHKQLVSTRVYTNIADGCYNQTSYGYDMDGRQQWTETPAGTITWNVLDSQDQTMSTWVGTDDTPTNPLAPWSPSNNDGNMVDVTDTRYDADGDVTSVTQHVGGGTPDRTTLYAYDWRDRQTFAVNPPDAQSRITYATTQYDNLDEATETQQYEYEGSNLGDGLAAAAVAGSAELTTSDLLLAQGVTAYDSQGNVYRTTQYGVTPSGGLDATTLVSNAWYDANGNVIKSQPAGSDEFTKSAYDGLGDLIAQYVGYDTSETTSDLYDSSGNVTLHLSSNAIFQETQTAYDAAGNAVETTTYDRLPTATDTGPLDQIPSEARVSYTADWYDGIGRQTVDADYGTNSSTPPETAPVYNTTSGQWVDGEGNPIPALVNGTYYNPAGEAYQTIDPKGIVSQTAYDAAGEVTATIQDYVGDGIPSASYPDQNVTVETTYTPDGQVATSTAVNPTTGNQTTTYVYGTSLADSGIASADLLRAVIYPGSTNTFTMSGRVPVFSNGSGGYDRVEYQYDIQGEETQVEDQNQTIHDYYYDRLGRETSDQVTQLGSGIDGSIMRIDFAYDLRGDEDQITSYSSASGGSANVVNEVFEQYNDWGLLVRDYQKETPGAITFDSSGTPDDGTPYVAYGYTDTANPTRLTTMTYPNGRVLHYVYNSGDDDALGRVSAIADDDGSGNPGQVLAAYTYLGLSQITGVSNPEPGISTGVTLDQFGRVENLTASTTGGDLVDLNYGYDADSNVVYRQDAVAGASNNLDEQYTYDGMNQLQSMTRGYMDLTGSTPVFTPSGLSQSWTLDATGNWTSVTTNGTTQDETANAANQITGISGGSVTPVYDNAGNMTLTPQPTDSTAGYNLVYDAWNRLVAVTTGSGGSQTMVAQYEYDGLNRRIVENTYSGGTLSQTTHYYLSSSDQVLEERPGNSTSANQQYVWGLRYVNDLVLRDDASCGGNLGIAGSGLGERLYAIQDANWNVVAIANTSGVVVERYTYTAYGQVEFRNANFSKTDGGLGDVSNYGWTTLFAGMDLGSVTGEYYDRARWYDPALGVFDTTDPTGYMGGMDLYEYCGDAPFGRTDSTGLFDVGCNCEGKWIDIPIRLGYVKGTSWVRWEGMKKDLDDANKIWAQCCIRFDLVNSNEPIIISQNIGPNGYLMIDVNAGAISETPFHVNNPTSINVFYVPGFVANYGSPDLGNAIGVSQAGSSNEYLTYTWTQFHQLAHEIGHTLLGPGHPDDNYNNSLEDPYTKRLMCKNASWQTDTELKSDECDTARQKAEELNQRFKNNAAAAK